VRAASTELVTGLPAADIPVAVSTPASAGSSSGRELSGISATRFGDDFVSRVLAVVESIPPGRVMTYGDVAAAIGSRAARAVGQVMAYYGSDVPWWRVIRSSGQAPLCHDAAALAHYEAEDTPLVPSNSDAGYRINLRAARHHP
jgi:alkylated DNA nucleotide flippase Atl1